MESTWKDAASRTTSRRDTLIKISYNLGKTQSYLRIFASITSVCCPKMEATWEDAASRTMSRCALVKHSGTPTVYGICVTWLIRICVTNYVSLRACETHRHAYSIWNMCDMTHSYLWHDSLIWLTYMCNVTPSHVWHESFRCDKCEICDLDSFIRATWLIHMWDMARSFVRHDTFLCSTRVE